jgi:hypothetical protein
MRVRAILALVFVFSVLGCGKDSDKNPTGPGGTRQVQLSVAPVVSGIDEAFSFMEAMDFALDGQGGFYFMDWTDPGYPEQQIFQWKRGEFYATGFTPSAILEAMGLTTAAGWFEDMDTDASGRLYFLLSYIHQSHYKALFYVDFEEQEIGYVIPPDVFTAILRSAGLTMDAYYSVKMRMLVTNEGDVWMIAADDKDAAAVILLEAGGSQVNVKHWPLPDFPHLNFYTDHKLGLGRNGDLLITDCRHGVLWRVTAQAGPNPYISLKNLPSTISGFCETPDGALVFATNFVLDIEVTFIHDGMGDEVEAIWSVFADGVDRLFYLIPKGGGFEAYVWDTSDLIQRFVQEGGSPEFWQFWLDPNDGSIWVADVAGVRGDVYCMTFQVESP